MMYSFCVLFNRIDNQDDIKQFVVLNNDIFTSDPNSYNITNMVRSFLLSFFCTEFSIEIEFDLIEIWLNYVFE